MLRLHIFWLAGLGLFAQEGRYCDAGKLGGIQAAIDACNKAGGGNAYVPPGRYVSGDIQLKDNVTLYLEAGAVLVPSQKKEDYK